MRQDYLALWFLRMLRLLCVFGNFVTQNCQPSQRIFSILIFFRRSAVIEWKFVKSRSYCRFSNLDAPFDSRPVRL